MIVSKSNLVLNILIIIGLLSKFGESMRFDLISGRTKCISEDIKLNGMTVGKYNVVNPNEGYPLPDIHKLNVKVTSPYGNSYHHGDLVESGTFAFTAAEAGDYTTCFWAPEHNPPATVTVEFEWKTGVLSKDWTKVAKKGQIDTMELELRKLFDTVSSIHEEMFYLREREEEMQLLMGYCSYFGKKIDPEPGRCRRTDGKKWRCSKDAHLNSKYCERHMNRSRSRSRKPVESQNTSQSLSTVGLDIATGNSRGSGSGGGSLIFQKPPLHSVGTREGICFRSNMSLSHMDHIPYGIPNKEYRCLQELKPETDNGVLSVASESLRGFTMNSSLDSARRVTTSGSSSNPLSDQRDFFLQNSCLPMQMQQDFDLLMANDATSKQQQQHYFFGREFDSSRPLKQEHQSLQPLPNELPKTIDFGCYLDDQRANKNSISTTQLSLPTPLASSKFFERSVHSSKDNFMDKFLS